MFVQNLCEPIRKRKMKRKTFDVLINLYRMTLFQVSKECG